MKNLKIFTVGVLSGAIMLTGATYHVGKFYDKKEDNKTFENKYGIPNLPLPDKNNEYCIEKKYSFDYYGKEITLQDENLSVWGFDSNGKAYKLDLEEVTTKKSNKEIIPANYLTKLEYNVYNSIQKKDEIINQYNVYQLFNSMTLLYKQYLNREDFEGKTERMNYIYDVCISYFHPESEYTFAKTKFKDLNNTIQKDIKEEIDKIKYMKENKNVENETKKDRILEDISNVINYKILKKGI